MAARGAAGGTMSDRFRPDALVKPSGSTDHWYAGWPVVLALALLGGALPPPEVAGQERPADQRVAEKRHVVEATLKKVAEFMRQERWAEARAVLDQAVACLGKDGPAELKRRAEQVGKDLDMVLRLEEIRLQKANLADGQSNLAAADKGYVAAFQEWGLGKVGDEPAKAAEGLRDSAARPALVAALDDWAGCTAEPERRDWVLAVGRRADPDPGRARARDPVVWKDKAALARLVQTAPVADWSPSLLTTLAKQLPPADRVALLRRAQQQYPGDFWLNFEIGNALRESKQPAEAVGFYRAALAVRPQAAAVYNNLGVVLHAAGSPNEAVAALRRALQLAPTLAAAHTNLGNVLRDRGQTAEAIASYRQAITLAPGDAPAHYQLGTVLMQVGKPDEAQAEYHKALALDPTDARARLGLGSLLQAVGRPAEAVAEYRKAIELDPKSAPAHGALGQVLLEIGRNAEAEASTRRALDLLPQGDPLRARLMRQLERCRQQPRRIP
jgi:serine/threonine-protein kinase